MIKILLIILASLIIYVLMARKTFIWFAEHDYFVEAYHGKFPTAAFWGATFWIFAIPTILFQKLMEEIEISISARYEVYSKKRKNKK